MHALWHTIRESPLGFAIKLCDGTNWDESVLAMLREHFKVLSIMRRPLMRPLLRHYPMVTYRYFGTYIATSFTKKVRRDILKAHYLYLADKVKEGFFSEVLRVKPTLWRAIIDGDKFAIALSFTHKQHYEGDLLLEFQKNAVPLYHLSFTIVPGCYAGSAAREVIAIGRLQGLRGQFDEIKAATKQCRDIALSHLLVAATQGIAAALEVKVLAGVRNSEQITMNLEDMANFYFDYDAFWETLLGTRCDKFYLMPVPLPEKSLDRISTSHRRRARLRRLFKGEVAASTKRFFIENFLKSNSYIDQLSVVPPR
jgi:uncharacterized protein VirK/YbjX